MSLVLNEEQQMLQESAGEFFRDKASVDAFRQLRSVDAPISTDLWREMVDFGWPAIMIPEDLGGLGFGISGLGMIAVEAGKNLSISPLFSSAALSAHALLQCKASEFRDGLIESIVSGDSLVALAFNESGHFSPHACAVEAIENEDGFVLNGAKTFVAEGGYADKILMTAVIESEPTLFVLDASAVGLQRQNLQLIDRRDYVNIEVSNVQVSKHAKLKWAEGNAQNAITSITNVGAVMAAAELYGCSLEAFERTRVYLGDRVQFEKRIGSFQALQHRMAFAYTQLQLLKSVLLDALYAVESNRKDASLAVSHAKTLANETASLVTREAIQMHGGIGITDELDVGLFYKRARSLKAQYGDSNYHKDRFASLSGY